MITKLKVRKGTDIKIEKDEKEGFTVSSYANFDWHACPKIRGRRNWQFLQYTNKV